jgi:polyhydroxyalkanoate synthesis regulator phasin
MLFETLKKTLYAGVGMAFFTRDKLEEMGKRLAEEAKLSEADAKKFIDEVLKKSEEAKSSFEKAVGSGVNAALERLDLPRRSDLKALEERVKALEAEVKALKTLEARAKA